jgi:hypothetical protein
MAEIGMLRKVWNPKIQLCWWHLRKAVRERLSKNKLSTTPYNVARACQEARFIDPTFVPDGNADPGESEGGMFGESINQLPYDSPNTVTIRISIPPAAQRQDQNAPQPSLPNTTVSRSVPLLGDRLNLDTIMHCQDDNAHATVGKFTIKLPARNQNQAENADQLITIQATATTRTFCPAEHRDTIISLMERHLCAHPLIPGYSHPSAQGIRDWAVKAMYNFCVEHDLRETWAYLWENWYRSDRWKLWARSVHATIPKLKTTMLLESQ